MEKSPGYKEFITLMAVMISLTAMSMDIMLPALSDIGRDLGATHPNDAQLVVSALVIGMGIGQILLGPLSDCFGRKPVIVIGVAIFSIGCLVSIFTARFEVMIAARVIQGIGAAGPRTSVVALIRDLYEGRAMARMISTVMAIFIIIPALAPSLGQTVLLFSGWRVIFGFLMLQGVIVLLWFSIRQPETLAPDKRISFGVRRIFSGAVEVCTTRSVLGYTLASGFITAVLIAYLSSSQQLFQEVYGLGRLFPLYMAFLALSMGCASLVNARLVIKFGMRTLSHRSVLAFIGLMAIYLAITFMMDGRPPLLIMMAFFSMAFFCMGMLFGNLNAIAMQPLGHIAGVGASVIGALASTISSSLGILVGRFYDGSSLPLAWGFVILGILTAATMFWADGYQMHIRQK